MSQTEKQKLKNQLDEFNHAHSSYQALWAELDALLHEQKATLEEIQGTYKELNGHYEVILEVTPHILTAYKAASEVNKLAKLTVAVTEASDRYADVSSKIKTYVPPQETEDAKKEKAETQLIEDKSRLDEEIGRLTAALELAKRERTGVHEHIMEVTFAHIAAQSEEAMMRPDGGATHKTSYTTRTPDFHPGHTSTPAGAGSGWGRRPPPNPSVQAATTGQHLFSQEDPFRFEGAGRAGEDWWASQNHMPEHLANPHDYSKVLARLPTPQFSGDKRAYETWKATFDGLMDQIRAPQHICLLHLRACLKDKPSKAIEMLGHSEMAYRMARERLERRYGGVQRPINIRMEELSKFRGIRDGNPEDIEQLAELIENLIIGYSEAGQVNELGGGTLYWIIQSKMSENLLGRYKWWLLQGNKTGNVSTLREFVNQEAVMTASNQEMIRGATTPDRGNRRFARQTMVSTNYSSPDQRRENRGYQRNSSGNDNKCKNCGGDHFISRCREFKALNPKVRWAKAREMYLCYRCLSSEHRGNECTRSKACGTDNCQATHHFLLHDTRGKESSTRGQGSRIKAAGDKDKNKGHSEGPAKSEDSKTTGATHLALDEDDEGASYMTTATYHTGGKDYIALRTVPVIIKNGNKALKINALLDDGSTRSYINEEAANFLGLTGEESMFTVRVLNDKKERFRTREVDLVIQSVDGAIRKNIVAHTVRKVTGNLEVLDWNRYKKAWPHLRKINFPLASKNTTVELLLGLDAHELHGCEVPEVRGRSGEPVARLTPLGWTCVGAPEMLDQNPACHVTLHAVTNYELSQGMTKFWEMEEPSTQTEFVRPEEIQAERITDDTMVCENGVYTVGVPWKDGRPDLKNNYRMALKRLESTERKLQRTEAHETSYRNIIKEYERKGYIKRVPLLLPGDTGMCNYVPHFAVIKEDRETTKMRVVFDASARYAGVSLNDTALTGPKLQRDLVQVLTRFRRHVIAIISDVKEMYMQIKLLAEDRCYHRFLWRDMDTDREPEAYEFWSWMFGAGCSPYVAQKVTRVHAKKNADKWPRAALTVLLSTYMDDSMDSVETVAEGKQLYHDLSALWKSMGMLARKWISNSRELLKAIPEGECAGAVNLDADKLPDQKTLGVWWNAQKDVFSFRVAQKEPPERITKRYFLSRVAALYDPLGFAAPFVVCAKVLMQEMWAGGTGWDEPVGEQLQQQAMQWFSQLQGLERLAVPRVLQPGGEMRSRELHTFVDASEKAFGSVTYLRCVSEKGDIHVRFVVAKSRVAPVTSVSIPRLARDQSSYVRTSYGGEDLPSFVHLRSIGLSDSSPRVASPRVS